MLREDPRLDRLEQFDERSRAFPIRQLVGQRQPRSYTWGCTVTLDQGREGACVGFAWAHELAARPVVIPATQEDALAIYRRAQQLDEWPGEAYSGTSVLAGAKATLERGWLVEYRWAFGLDDLILALGYQGPAVCGLPWYEGMYQPDRDGFIRPTGRQVGGHAILARGVNVRSRTVLLRNSWGPGWGRYGDCRITWDDLDRLLRERGEACVPVRR